MILLAGVAFAGSLQGRLVPVPPCTPEPTADCWATAPSLRRFAPAPGLLHAPARADVRLTHDADGLLIRVQGLPPHTHVELSLSPPQDARLARSRFLTLGVGISRLPTDPLEAGQLHPLRVALVSDDPDDTALLPWAPAGPGDLQHPAQALILDAPPIQHPVTISVDEAGIQVEAPGASHVRLAVQQTAPPRGSRAAPPPWSWEGAPGDPPQRPPATSWITAQVSWTDADGRLVGATRQRLWWTAPGPTAPLDIHPAPRWIQREDDAPYVLPDPARVCGGGEAARLLAEELRRFTGADIVTSSDGECDLLITDQAPLPAPAQPLAAHPDGFAVHISPTRATVVAPTLRGRVYGALALADAIGPDGSAPTAWLADAPDLDLRVLHWNLNLRSQPDYDVDTWVAFLRRVVARGRYNLVTLTLGDSLRYRTHPELAHGRALSPEQLRRMVRAAKALGIEIAPGANAPGHAQWLLSTHPELQEDANATQLCTRAPTLHPLLTEIYDELLELFDHPRWFHAGLDEARWRTASFFGDERCPRCATSARWQLLADFMDWETAFFQAREVRPIYYTDMLLPGWNGGRNGTWRALDLLADTRAPLFASWSPLGDSVGRLARQRGLALIRLHTGYRDWKRAGLRADHDVLAGEGLGLFTPTPWSTFGPSAGTRPLDYAWPSVLLAGATAWRNDLEEYTIVATLDALRSAPAYHPGYVSPPGRRWRPVRAQGTPPGADLPQVSWPARVHTRGLDLQTRRPVVARPGRPVVLPIGRKIASLSLLQTTALAHDTAARLRKPGASPVATLEIRWGDGQVARRPIRFGIDTERPDADPRAALLWGAADSAQIPTSTGRPALAFRLDWVNPRPQVPVNEARMIVEDDGAALIIAGAAVLLPSPP